MPGQQSITALRIAVMRNRQQPFAVGTLESCFAFFGLPPLKWLRAAPPPTRLEISE